MPGMGFGMGGAMGNELAGKLKSRNKEEGPSETTPLVLSSCLLLKLFKNGIVHIHMSIFIFENYFLLVPLSSRTITKSPLKTVEHSRYLPKLRIF